MARFDNMNRNGILKIIIAILILVILGLMINGFVVYSNYQKMSALLNTDAFYENISVNYVDLEGLTKEEALNKLDADIQTPLRQSKIVLIASNNDEIPYEYSHFNVKYDFDTAVEEAYQHGRTGSIKERYEVVSDLPLYPFNVDAKYSYDEEILKNEVAKLAEQFYIEPVNATMTRKNGEFVITKEVYGQEVNQELLIDAIKGLISDKREGSVVIPVTQIEPEYTAEKLSQSQSLIGSYSTSYSGGGGRVTNMSVAAGKINDTIVYPEEIFSTNLMFGPTTGANGYKPAPTIVGGKLVDDYGGGVCQVSSTLYNALLYAELDIVERQNHSLKVGYVDYGFDATLAGDYIDLKFKNSSDYPIYVESYLTGSKVVVNLYGHEEHSNDRRLAFEKALVETIPAPAESITYDDTLPDGTRKENVTPLTGYKYNVYKLVYEGNKMLEKTLVNTSTYKPRRGEVVIGTNKTLVHKQSDENPVEAANSEASQTLETIPSLDQTTEPASNPVNEPLHEQVVQQEQTAEQEQQPVENIVTNEDASV